ncbi:hypothetical protein DSLASN_14600 [Desulfoluna limicola]|uniref:Alginate export domain-containing protein n=1 Tax=Desulfoluna limicola TaxID=2810562 RepID=A0ABM7PFI4_9BACT|nr:hypothetical protein [Desulfoluna limicola]BCS95828.1 hypothetical protein DSLASN_14600 [Desulfoluna limicola]
MRRCLLFLSLVLSMLIASPALALDLDVSGSLQFEGVYNEKATLQKSDRPDSYREMRLRVLTEAQVTDKIKLIARFDALDKVLSSRDSAFDNNEDDDNIDFDRAYAEIITPVGLLSIGRMQGVVWGTSWSDDETDTDRIKLVTPIPIGTNKLYIGAVAEKVDELDKGVEESNKDNNKYYIGATYQTPTYRTGLLTAFYHFNTFQDPEQRVKTANYTEKAATLTEATNNVAAATGVRNVAYGVYGPTSPQGVGAQAALDAATAVQVSADTANTAAFTDLALLQLNQGVTTQAKVFLLAPYFDGKFGPLGITTELDYVFGESEYDANNTTRDIAAYSYFAEARYDIGPVTAEAGYAYTMGKADLESGDIENMAYVAPGADWAKAFILTGDEHGMNSTMGGGLGNLVGDGFAGHYRAALDGYSMFYLGANYTCLNDTLTLGALIATSKADDTPAGVDDDHGIEYDLTLSWKIWDNLVYSGVAAYLQAGDYWSERANDLGLPSDGEDTYAFYHKLELFF